MAKLSTGSRRALPANSFAGPGRSFPIPDATHARAALVGVPKALKAGNITASEAAHIKAVARAKLGKTKGPNRDTGGIYPHMNKD